MPKRPSHVYLDQLHNSLFCLSAYFSELATTSFHKLAPPSLSSLASAPTTIRSRSHFTQRVSRTLEKTTQIFLFLPFFCPQRRLRCLPSRSLQRFTGKTSWAFFYVLKERKKALSNWPFDNKCYIFCHIWPKSWVDFLVKMIHIFATYYAVFFRFRGIYVVQTAEQLAINRSSSLTSNIFLNIWKTLLTTAVWKPKPNLVGVWNGCQ